MRHTVVIVLAVLLAAGAIAYGLLVVANDVRNVADELDVVARDLSSMTDDVRSLADDVNALADALAGEEGDDDQQRTPTAGLRHRGTANVALRLGRAAASSRRPHLRHACSTRVRDRLSP